MYSKNQICARIRSIYPDVGKCGSDIKLDFDKMNNAWSIQLQKGKKRLKTFLETEDATSCMENQQCLGLGWQIYQLKDNINQLTYAS